MKFNTKNASILILTPITIQSPQANNSANLDTAWIAGLIANAQSMIKQINIIVQSDLAIASALIATTSSNAAAMAAASPSMAPTASGVTARGSTLVVSTSSSLVTNTMTATMTATMATTVASSPSSSSMIIRANLLRVAGAALVTVGSFLL